MKRNKLIGFASTTLLVLGLAACDVEKTGEGQYKVETPTSEEVTASAHDAVDQTATALETAGAAVEEGARDAAQATGTALETAGKEIQEHAKPGDQKH